MKTIVTAYLFWASLAASQLAAPRLQQAKAGDIATGVILLEDQRQLRLDAAPCARTQDKVIVLFRSPYKKVPVPKVNCNGRLYTRFQVIQQQSGR
jgi:hypothetical protein